TAMQRPRALPHALILLTAFFGGGRLAWADDRELTRIPFRPCFEAPGWQRPPEDRQLEFLSARPRYLPMTRAKLRSDKHWTSAFLLLTDYGLSARFDQTNLTGLWTLEHDFDHYFRSCYRGDRVRAMAQGQIAEILLIG